MASAQSASSSGATTERYFGFVKNKQRHGLGTVFGLGFVYEGGFSEGEWSGNGRMDLGHLVYEGPFVHSKPVGAAKIKSELGVFVGRVQGEYRLDGPGEWVTGGGAVFRGNFKGFVLHGVGYCKDQKGRVYEGEWVHGVKEGQGEEIGKNAKYRGGWKEGKRHGPGVYEAENWKYEGEWVLGKREGNGIYTEGSLKYTGTFEKDYRCGFGKLENGKSTYIGGFDFDAKHGIGFQISGKINTYFGEWANDQKHGLGVLNKGDTEMKAEWKNDQMHGVCFVTSPGKPGVAYIYENGSLSKQVPKRSEVDNLLKRIAENLPQNFFEYSENKLKTLIIRKPSSMNSSNLKKILGKVDELKATFEKSIPECEKSRLQLQGWLKKRLPNLNGPGKEWDVDELRGKKKKETTKSAMSSDPRSPGQDFFIPEEEPEPAVDVAPVKSNYFEAMLEKRKKKVEEAFKDDDSRSSPKAAPAPQKKAVEIAHIATRDTDILKQMEEEKKEAQMAQVQKEYEEFLKAQEAEKKKLKEKKEEVPVQPDFDTEELNRHREEEEYQKAPKIVARIDSIDDEEEDVDPDSSLEKENSQDRDNSGLDTKEPYVFQDSAGPLLIPEAQASELRDKHPSQGSLGDDEPVVLPPPRPYIEESKEPEDQPKPSVPEEVPNPKTESGEQGGDTTVTPGSIPEPPSIPAPPVSATEETKPSTDSAGDSKEPESPAAPKPAEPEDGFIPEAVTITEPMPPLPEDPSIPVPPKPAE